MRLTASTRTSTGARQRRWATSWSQPLATMLLVLVVVLLVCVSPNVHRVEGAKSLKALAKTFVFQQLTMRKNFLPLPVPIPVPIEINDPPVYLKGKPKYVNVYKPKPTAAPAVVKPTTVYHMPIYSPTYEYMSMDPSTLSHSPLYAAGGQAYPSAGALMASPYGPSSGSSGYKSSSSSSFVAGLDTDGLASAASGAGNGQGAAANPNFSDYDDDTSATGSYYAAMAAARRRRAARQLAQAAANGDYSLSLGAARRHLRQHDDGGVSYNDNRANDYATLAARSRGASSAAGSEHLETDEMVERRHQLASRSDEIEETIDDDDDDDYNEDSNERPLKRTKRQVYYQSGYEGNNCEGLPVEINVRSRIKMDQMFPIFGKSQMKKCVKLKKPSLLPPPEEHY